MSLKVSLYDDTLHIVGEDIPWYAEHVECMDHTDEQILLPRVREELYVHLPTVMTDHRKTGNLVFIACRIGDPCESPVHLVGFSRTCRIPASAVSLWIDLLTSGWNQILMSSYVILYGRQAACITKSLKMVGMDR